MSREATPDHPIHELLVRRWSPYGIEDRSVSREDLHSLFEAARWAASSYNEQPWRYIVATRDQPEEFEKLLSCLVEANRVWAAKAPVLALGVSSLHFSRNGKPNAHAAHDLALATANLTVEATARGLSVHQMAGILPDRAREVYGIPEGFQAFTGMAIGYATLEPEDLPEELRKRDQAPRTRKPLKEIVFGAKWESPSSLLG